MTLAEWIELRGMARSAVAEALGVSPAYVTNLCSPQANWPGRDLMVRIRDMTGGDVTANDFLPPVSDETADVAEAAA
jgi:transcriptional regulator with XRE-family HTH domain